jgi:8-oxo-dGTP pyrophosphatase MutT (NUDIX family)
MSRRDLAWKVIDSKQVADCRVFTVQRNICNPPHSQEEHDFYVLRCPNWVNVIPITASNEVVLIEQYRHGSDSITLEIPGGIIDPHDESSQHAGSRELLEETGYRAKEMIFLGRTHPNPALQGNYCDMYLAPTVEKVQSPQFDWAEDIELKLVPYEHIPSLIETGAISASLVIAAFHFLSMYETKNKKHQALL